MWIDTHVHFNANQFLNSQKSDWQLAQNMGVKAQIIPCATFSDLDAIPSLANQFKNSFYTLGIHPFFIKDIPKHWQETLEYKIIRHLNDPYFLGIGEIGLDNIYTKDNQNQQLDIFISQLKLAQKYQLPVILHNYKAVDTALKHLKKYQIKRCISHAFGGSLQQANQHIDLGYKLGFGGAFTYPRANRLQKLIKELPIECFVLETDAPYMPPEWIRQETNYSYHLPRIAEKFAAIRNIEKSSLAKILQENINAIFPQLETGIK